MRRIFVYGSLKQGEFNFERFGKQTVVSKGATITGYSLYDLTWYPCIAKDDNRNSFVHGEVHEVDDAQFERLNRMEEGAGYRAYQVRPLGWNEECTCWAFEKPPSHGKLNPRGIWVDPSKIVEEAELDGIPD